MTGFAPVLMLTQGGKNDPLVSHFMTSLPSVGILSSEFASRSCPEMRMKSQKVLIVDDEAQMRRVLRVSLSAQGYEVVEAASGEEALRRVPEHFDCILLDLNLPGLDGIATCRAIRASSQVPIVVVSIRDSEGDKSAAREAGADDYVTKPFRIEELLAHIDALTRDRHEVITRRSSEDSQRT